MEISIFIAKIVAVVYLSIGVGLIFNKKLFQKLINELISNPSIRILGGSMAIIIGFLILQYHNNWEANWTVVITIIGWTVLIEGILLLTFPKFVTVVEPLFNNTEKLSYVTIIILIVGLVFAYFGFFYPS